MLDLTENLEMSGTKIRFEQIEDGQTLKQVVVWFRNSQRAFPARFNALRSRSRAQAKRAGLGPQGVERLISQTRAHRAKT